MWKLEGELGVPKMGGDPKFGALTITLEHSGRVAKTEETQVVTLMTRGVTGFRPKLNSPASHSCDVI